MKTLVEFRCQRNLATLMALAANEDDNQRGKQYDVLCAFSRWPCRCALLNAAELLLLLTSFETHRFHMLADKNASRASKALILALNLASGVPFLDILVEEFKALDGCEQYAHSTVPILDFPLADISRLSSSTPVATESPNSPCSRTSATEPDPQVGSLHVPGPSPCSSIYLIASIYRSNALPTLR